MPFRFEQSRMASATSATGFTVGYMAGGHYAWKALKGPVKLFE